MFYFELLRIFANFGINSFNIRMLTLKELFSQWLISNSVDEDLFDNQPLHIVEVFPPLDSNLVTRDFLEQRVWWWRFATAKRYKEIFRYQGHPQWSDILFSLFKDRFSRSAYAYELLTRCSVNPSYPLVHPWIRCSQQQRRMLSCMWPNLWPSEHWLPIDDGRNNWATLSGNYNLELNDKRLIEQFKKQIEAARVKRNIRKPSVGQGVPRKDFAWSVIENMDLRYFLGNTLSAGARSQVSKAKSECQKLCSEAGIQL